MSLITSNNFLLQMFDETRLVPQSTVIALGNSM